MTDFDKKAREVFFALTNRKFPLMDSDAGGDFATIASALKAAYNEGLDDAATAANLAQHRITGGISHIAAQGHKSACWLIESNIRAKKLPT